MPNTTNYSFPTPADTDLVKNGADAIRDLGDAVDTAMNTALGTKKAGMVLLNTTSFSAVASQSINNVFSADYDNYLILLPIGCTADVVTRIRLRVGGSDDSTGSSYAMQRLNAAGTSVAANLFTADSFNALPTHNTNNNAAVINLFHPFLARPTLLTAQVQNSFDSSSLSILSGQHNQSTSYTGFTIFPASGTITGSVSVFAYAK